MFSTCFKQCVIALAFPQKHVLLALKKNVTKERLTHQVNFRVQMNLLFFIFFYLDISRQRAQAFLIICAIAAALILYTVPL
jgi:hypothetical protein